MIIKVSEKQKQKFNTEYIRILEAVFKIEDMQKVSDMIINQLSKRLKTEAVRFAPTKSGSMRKVRGEDLYALKYQLKDDYHTNVRIISFLWSTSKGGQLIGVRIFDYIPGRSKYSKISAGTPKENWDVINIGIPAILKKLEGYFLKSFDDEIKQTTDELSSLKKEYQSLIKTLRDKGGEFTGYFYRYKDNKEVILRSLSDHAGFPLMSIDYLYHINSIKKVLGIKYDPNYTNENILNFQKTKKPVQAVNPDWYW